KPIVLLGRRHQPVIAESKLEREIWLHLETILDERSQRPSCNAAERTSQRDVEGVRSTSDEIGDVGKAERPGILVEVVVVEPAELATKLERMTSAQIAH